MISRKSWSDEKLLARAMAAKSDRAYWENIRELRSRQSPWLFRIASDLMHSEILKDRITGINLLAQSGRPIHPFGKQAIAAYFALLKTETDPEIQTSLLFAIGHNNSGLSVSRTRLAAAFASSEHRKVRSATVHALLGVENDTAVRAMIALSGDKSSEIRNWATFGLGEQIDTENTQIRDALWARVTDRHADTRAEAIRGLAKRQDQRVIPLIEAQLASGIFGALLFDAITATGDENFLPQLLLLQQQSENDGTVNEHWLERLGDCIRSLQSNPRQARRN